jgi:hypothetical protein
MPGFVAAQLVGGAVAILVIRTLYPDLMPAEQPRWFSSDRSYQAFSSGRRHDDRVSAASLLVYVASAVLLAWGAAHLPPTRAVTDGFGNISQDNRRILVMEWIAEGITHMSIAVLVILMTAIEGSGDSASQLVYRVTAVVLVVLAALTTVTGARTPVVWFRVCPFVLTGTAALLLLASLL